VPSSSKAIACSGRGGGSMSGANSSSARIDFTLRSIDLHRSSSRKSSSENPKGSSISSAIISTPIMK
jgi:hypothetical protein